MIFIESIFAEKIRDYYWTPQKSAKPVSEILNTKLKLKNQYLKYWTQKFKNKSPKPNIWNTCNKNTSSKPISEIQNTKI